MTSSWSAIVLIVRSLMFGIISVFSLFIIGIDAHIANVLSQASIIAPSNIASLTIAILTLVTLPPILAISIIRKGLMINMIAIELGVMGIFWVLWIAASILTVDQTVIYCAFIVLSNNADTLSCAEPEAAEAFSWLNWIIITGYIVILLVLAVLQHVWGNPVWTKPVNNVDLFAPRVVVVTPVYNQKTEGYTGQQSGSYPLQPQLPGAPQAQMAYPPRHLSPINTGYPILERSG